MCVAFAFNEVHFGGDTINMDNSVNISGGQEQECNDYVIKHYLFLCIYCIRYKYS